SRRRHTRFSRDWSSDVCSSDLRIAERERLEKERLDRENQRRAARGQPPIEKLADLGDVDPPDPVLKETTEIAADLSRMQGLYLRSEERRVGKECRARRVW